MKNHNRITSRSFYPAGWRPVLSAAGVMLTTWILAFGATAWAQSAPSSQEKTNAAKPKLASATLSPSKLPASKYKHSDRLRPRPTVVTPPTASTQAAPGQPPSDAIVLFGGQDLAKWARWLPSAPNDLSKPAPWVIKDGCAEVVGGTIQTREKFSDCHFHLEWCTSPEEAALGDTDFDQHRGNSGVFIGDHPEIQVMDSYENDTYPDGQAGAIYGAWPPLVNTSRKPGEWQSYDIFYFAPHFQDGKKVKSAIYTMLHNGLPVHHNVEVAGEEVECRLRLQAHGGKVRYRNIWVRPLHRYDENEGKPLPPGARTTDPWAEIRKLKSQPKAAKP